VTVSGPDLSAQAVDQIATLDELPEGTGPQRRWFTREAMVAYLFILPTFIGFVVFYAYPAIRGFYLSFTDYNLLSPPEWVGLANYQRMIGDDLFWNALLVTVEYVVLNIFFQTILALALAVLLDRLVKSAFWRSVFVLPWLIANVVVAILWQWMLDFNLGIVNVWLEAVGIGPIAFFGSTTWAIPTIAWVNVWRHLGYTALLIFAGLQTIPKDLYEAGGVDGASEWKMFWRITMPLLRPVLALVLVVTIIGSFQVFDTVAVTTQGGPVNASRVIQFYIFQKAFELFEFGYGAALSMGLFVILLIVTLIQMRTLRASESDVA
jgi:multiple sugar transport system permease protein